MTDNAAVVKIIANHTREYNELDRLYKKLGVKHLTLMEVHKTTLEKMAKLESQHHDLRADHIIVVERAVTVKQLYTKLKGENKKLKVLLEVATKEIKKFEEWVGRWQEYFMEFMTKYNDIDMKKPLEVKDMVDELSIQLDAFMGW